MGLLENLKISSVRAEANYIIFFSYTVIVRSLSVLVQYGHSNQAAIFSWVLRIR